VDGEPYPFAPRVILKKALEKASARNLTFMAGAEVEYFLLRRDSTGPLRPADERDDAALPCYDSRGVSRMYDHLTAVSDAMVGLGWGPYASDHEDGNGQFEQNFRYADALTTADRVVTMRYLLQMFAEQRGMIATFMPKPFTDRTGNGLHLHMSLWEGDNARFPAGEGEDDAHGLGLSSQAYAFVGGLLEHAPALHSLVAPTVNSYKRTGATTTASGATWAPRSASYGGNDRTHMIRVPDAQRVELRATDGSACSYLALAGALTAGLDGIDRGLDPGSPGHSSDPAVQQKRATPRTLLDAVHALEADPVISGVLDAADPAAGVSAYYAQLKREEFYAWHNQVTAWEIDHYLTAV
jgi:glutamine synthetase